MATLRDLVVRWVESKRVIGFERAQKEIACVLRSLAEDGTLAFEDDYQLGNEELEIKVATMLRHVGWTVERGRPGCEDLVVNRQPPGDQPPIVIEVKSGGEKKSSPDLRDARQLDDWVFALSDGNYQRKSGLGRRQRGLPRTGGWNIGAAQGDLIGDPNPHKGLLVFNGQRGVRFEERKPVQLPANVEDFVVQRCICVAYLPVLVAWESAVKSGTTQAGDLWAAIQRTDGVLLPPSG